MPRDVHPDVHQIDNVYVYNIDDLQAIVHENAARRNGEVQLAESLIREKTAEFAQWLAALQSGQEHTFKHYDKNQPTLRDA
jgi:glutamyl-tRNA reductase